ncbi:uncharacterized protein AC631_01258 [Debaryomyces fabryi]|uniref:Nodulin-like domain-containing protein n=1 Tax=Debaryomyces fabryi TaxID=58627 RepID=A0A0V1Q388_9ASCO|nr:uncharacterized protein AC631_01258 [Debaryomyces fabryi]KSA03003.1 hypothetical protein AC631_01258 [Debaryomyces fabryi]CUM47389.1 unnamed protein product [Debaryomyces fabryi]
MISLAVRKAFVLLSCTFLGLICGTLYLYSSYSPQFAKRLNYTVTDSSSIALSGTIGIAVAGPLAGGVVDKKGYTIALIIGGLSIISGYLGMKKQFDNQYSDLFVSSSFLFLIGCGSTFINSACLKCCAVSFPSIRGVATSLPLALYGLSALFYSVIASVFFPGKTSEFLGFLAYSSVGIFVICAPSIMFCDKEHKNRKKNRHINTESIEMATLAPTHSPASSSIRKSQNALKLDGSRDDNLSGIGLIKSYRFWLIFITTGSLASLGQMYIYSVGYMVKALITEQVLKSDTVAAVSQPQVEALIQKNQQLQVGLLSIANCVGRIASGIIGDIISQSLHKPRSWLLFLPSMGLLTTQAMGLQVSDLSSLSMMSLLTGFFYGFTFCIMPIIVGDTFGMDNFSSNWGVVGLAPILPSYYFTSLFGKVYDSNSIILQSSGISNCSLGKNCYSSVFKLTLGVTILSLVVVTLLNFRNTSWSKRKH